ncbi:MAG: phosphoenolpyruvate hydrolase family protein, partial [Hyphomicrobiales bacterium]
MAPATRFLVGAAVGSGLAAIAAQRGGADFLLALNAGWLRAKGAPSIASILPVEDGNGAVLNLGKNEIIPQCTLPVFFGANVYEPRDRWQPLIAEAKLQGFAGLVNFPTAIHLPVDLQKQFSSLGIGFAAELELLSMARRAGLQTLAYVRSKRQAMEAAESGVDIVCLNFGWNIGGTSGAKTHFTIDDVRYQADDVYRAIVRRHPHVKFLLEGGPIETAEDLASIYRSVPVHGYIGGSTLDRLPTEISISDKTRGFKSVDLLAGEMQRREEDSIRHTQAIGLIGTSKPIRQTFDKLRALSGFSGPVFVHGEVGSGRGFAAEALHRMGARRLAPYAELSLTQLTGHEAGIRLFGRGRKNTPAGKLRVPGLLETLDGGSLYIEEISHLPKRLQTRLARYLERGQFSPLDGRRVISSDVRIICCSEFSLISLTETGSMDGQLCSAFFGNDVAVPPLRDRPDDIPVLLRSFIDQIRQGQSGHFSMDASAIGVLSAHTWPGNITEIRRLAVRLAELSGPTISAADILATMETIEPRSAQYLDERD